MGRFTLYIFIAFIAFQTTSGASLKSNTELEELVALYAKASKDLVHIQDFIAKHISTIAREFEYKIQEVLEDKAIYPVIEELRNAISQIEADTNEDLKSCTETAWTQTVTVTENTKTGIDDCISAAYVVEADLKHIVENIDGKVVIISNELTNGYHLCMEQPTDQDKIVCLTNVIYPTIDDIHNLDLQVKETHHTVNHVFDEGVRHLKMCLQNVKHNAEQMSEKILGDLHECVQVDKSILFQRTTRGIFDFFRELKEKIEAIIHLATHLPHSIEELQDKINEIVAHVNMHFLISQLKSEVDDIIEQGGRNAEKCRPDADKKMNNLMKTSEDAATVCMATTESHVDAIQDKIHAVVEEGKALLGELNKKILTCMWDNKLNPIGFAKCLDASYVDFKQKVSALQEKASAVIDECKIDAKNTIQEFSKCMSEVQLNMINKGQKIISETEECVRFA